MVSEGKSQMYAQFQWLWKGEGDLIPDPLLLDVHLPTRVLNLLCSGASGRGWEKED